MTEEEDRESVGLDIWFAEDIRNALLAANEASAATAAVIAEMGEVSPTGQAVADSTDLLAVGLRAYREGYKAALATVALAFGIAPQAITLRPCSGQALRQPFDSAHGGAQDRALRVEPRGGIPHRPRLPESGEELL